LFASEYGKLDGISAKAQQYSQEAHEKSESPLSKAGTTAHIERVKRADGVGKTT
jgi:hypothetical protein